MSEIDDFVRRQQHASRDLVPEQLRPKPIRHFIPAHYLRACMVQEIIDAARAKGATDAELTQIRTMLEPPLEPQLVSLDTIYGEEARV